MNSIDTFLKEHMTPEELAALDQKAATAAASGESLANVYLAAYGNIRAKQDPARAQRFKEIYVGVALTQGACPLTGKPLADIRHTLPDIRVCVPADVPTTPQTRNPKTK
ncbi:MAG: hypothetical protein LBU87_00010 [Lactobacillales bacterium]|jgi:hypothetical protein|nr:hypothetical protein [Lactobacillales bacterium]